MSAAIEDYAERFVREALERTPADVVDDVYVVSVFVYDADDDARRPTATVGFNAESQVRREVAHAEDTDEARWNFAFWLQNELGVLGDQESDGDGAALINEWVHGLGLWYSDEEEDADFEATAPKAEQITARFVDLLVATVQRLHAEGDIVRIFGRPVGVLIHELEYYDEIAAQNLRANPDGLADDFAGWIADMS